VAAALGWGALAASSLMVGALIGRARGGINGFAAGALLVMPVDSMIPEATEQAGRTTGLVTALGFAVAAGLSLD
jgi:ZIP family zinc transporter